jgi:hypothetical protein
VIGLSNKAEIALGGGFARNPGVPKVTIFRCWVTRSQSIDYDNMP